VAAFVNVVEISEIDLGDRSFFVEMKRCGFN